MNTIRRRLVNVRVTDQEFERIKTASDRQGARCISEFARAVMLDGATTGAASDSATSFAVHEKLLGFERRLAMLELYVSRLTDAPPPAKAGRRNSEN